MNKEPLDWGWVLPHADKGLGVPYLSYGSGRLGATVTRWGGLHQVTYYGMAPESAAAMYFEADAASAYTRLFRAQIRVNRLLYNLELTETDHYPFGYRSRFSVPGEGLVVEHSLTLLNDALVVSVDVLENPNAYQITLELDHHCGTQLARSGDVVRTWTQWVTDDELAGLTITAHDSWTEEGWQKELDQMKGHKDHVGLAYRTAGLRQGTTHIGLVGDDSLSVGGSISRMQIVSQPFSDGRHAIALVFASNRDDLIIRASDLRPIVTSCASAKQGAYRDRLKSAPHLSMKKPILESYFSHAPGVSETLMVTDVPGAMRASAMHYWVWGWDTVMCAEAYLASGNSAFVLDALRFYEQTADPKNGWGHQFTRDLKVRIPQAESAQCLYIIMLMAYVAYTGDAVGGEPFYPFAKRIFDRTIQSLNHRGLGTGPALWPDFPHYAGHTGQDCSVFNNSILYQGVRAMEALAHIYSDGATADQARSFSRRLEASFAPTFWDNERNYFVDSVDSVTLEQRKCYPSHALLWQSAYCGDLAHEKLADCAAFIAANHATNRGFLPYPRWDTAFNGDRNQLGQAWPITDVFDTMVLAAAGNQAMLAQWAEGLEWFWNQLTVPEAYSMQAVNDAGTPDAPGGKQPFSAKSWYMAILQSLAGVAFDIGGVTLMPGLAGRVEVANLSFRDRALAVSAEGDGHYPASLLIDGVAVVGTCKAPLAMITGAAESPKSVRVDYRRTKSTPNFPVILALNGGEIHEVDSSVARGLTARVSSHQDTWLRYVSPAAPTVTLDGEQITGEHDAQAHEGKALLPLHDGEIRELRIR